jgi:hypothetical protein
MKFIQGHNRTHINLFPVSLDESIDPDNEVRMIDLFVESLSLKDYGFREDFVENGRPAYHPSDLLKLFIYGYMNKVRFSRDPEKECRNCQLRSQCTRSKKERLIRRSEYAEHYERNHINIQQKEHLYKRRQTIVEHPYGTIKRQWGFNYILTKKGTARASADVGFIFIAYNLRRIGNILTMNVLKEYLRMLASLFLAVFDLIRRISEVCDAILIPYAQMSLKNRLSLKTC